MTERLAAAFEGTAAGRNPRPTHFPPNVKKMTTNLEFLATFFTLGGGSGSGGAGPRRGRNKPAPRTVRILDSAGHAPGTTP